MEKDAEARNVKDNDGRDSKKPGPIVAGPEAHANEGAGTTPQAPREKPSPARAGEGRR